MRSLNSMMAEFRRGKDKKKRRKRTLAGSAGKGAAIGMGVPLSLGTLAGATGAGIYAAKTGMKPGMVGLSIPAGGLGGLAATASKAPGKVLAAGALGGGIGAGLYRVNKLKDRNKKTRSPLSVLRK